jgi:hypothetical protein
MDGILWRGTRALIRRECSGGIRCRESKRSPVLGMRFRRSSVFTCVVRTKGVGRRIYRAAAASLPESIFAVFPKNGIRKNHGFSSLMDDMAG